MIAIYERKAPAHGLKHTETSNEYFENNFFFERKYLIMKSTSTISTNYSQDKNTHFLLFLFLNRNFYFLFVVTLIVVTLRSHFYYTAVR